MAVELCETWWHYFFCVLIETSLFVCIPLANTAVLEMRHTECEIAGEGSFPAQGGQDRSCFDLQACSRSLSLCDFQNVIAISAPSVISLSQHPVSMTTYPQNNAPNSVTACTSYGARCPLSIMFLEDNISLYKPASVLPTVAHHLSQCAHILTQCPYRFLPPGFPGNCCSCDSPHHSILIWVSDANRREQTV
jgi:hypothetical protein